MREVVIILVLACALVAAAGCLDGGTDDDAGGLSDVSSMTYSQFYNDYTLNRDTENQIETLLLKSFDEGDTVVIEDGLQNLTYNATQDRTIIQFASSPHHRLFIGGDITDEFQAGDTVTLTSGIVNTTFTHPIGGQSWTVHYETFAAGWDVENNTRTPIPRERLEHAEEG